jgi:DNA-binding winged helix-turn-helix (wHTH) protein
MSVNDSLQLNLTDVNPLNSTGRLALPAMPPLTDQLARLAAYLIHRRGATAPYADINDHLWPGHKLDPNKGRQEIARLRRCLAGSPYAACIVNRAWQGYAWDMSKVRAE